MATRSREAYPERGGQRERAHSRHHPGEKTEPESS